MKWRNNSCAYDVLIYTLYHLWIENESEWSKIFISDFKNLYFLVNQFKLVKNQTQSFEKARYLWRQKLSKKEPQNFNIYSFTDILDLFQYSFKLNKLLLTTTTTCLNCLKILQDINLSETWYGPYLYP